MAKKLSSLSIFFPAYNEEANIKKTVEEALKVAKSVTDNYEVLVVNDGSGDDTARIVQEIVKKDPHVRLINHAQNQGYGAALMSGFMNATKGWIFFSDADLQFDLSEIEKLIEKTDKYDVVLGYRKKRNDPFMRLLNAKGWNVLNRLFFGLKVKDIDCAFKLFRADAIKPILHEIESRGAMISAELLVRLHRAGYEFAEVGVNHYPRTAGSATGAKPSVIVRAFKEMAMVYRGDLGNDWVKGTIKFMVVGGFNTVVDLGVYFGLTHTIFLLANHKMWAKGISYIVGMLNSFIWNRAISKRAKETVAFDILPLAVISVAAVAINTSVMYVSYETLGISEIWSLLIATGVTFAWNFMMSKVLRRS